MDYRRLICPRPPSPILRHGCNTSGRSLPHAPPTGCSPFIKNSIPRPMSVVPFVTENSFNEPFAKTNRLLGYCLRTHPGGHPSWGSRPRRMRLPGLEVDGQRPVGRQAPLPTASRQASRSRPPGGCCHLRPPGGCCCLRPPGGCCRSRPPGGCCCSRLPGGIQVRREHGLAPG